MDMCAKCKGNGKIRYDRPLSGNPELAVAGEYICPECKGSGGRKQVVDKLPLCDVRALETITHDGLVFFISRPSFQTANALVGFYYDRLGILQSIHRASVYGKYICEHFA